MKIAAEDKTEQFVAQNRSFFEYMVDWKQNLKPAKLSGIIGAAGGPEHVVIVSVDVIEGFCRVGPLASDRVKGIIKPIVDLLEAAHSLGVKNVALAQDAHEKDSLEFGAFPPHCLEGTPEAEPVEEFRALPFFPEFRLFPKRSVSSDLETGLGEWLMEKEPKAVIVVGDCTDLCTYQLATFIRHLANSRHLSWQVILPADCVQTYDMPVDTAKSIGAMAHPGDFFHLTFLYHLGLEGVKVFSHLE